MKFRAHVEHFAVVITDGDGNEIGTLTCNDAKYDIDLQQLMQAYAMSMNNALDKLDSDDYGRVQ